VATGKVADHDALEARRRLRTVTSLEDAARQADLVIEAVPERMDLKVEVFAQLDRVAPRARDPRLQHVVAQHHRDGRGHAARAAGRWPALLQPVHRMKLLEIVRALETSEKTLALCEEVGGGWARSA
jgi:3-hydroxybutyryl-CoA dehydrogenase